MEKIKKGETVMKDKVKIITSILFIIVIITVSIFWSIYQWDMCRDSGMEYWYCVQHTVGVIL